MSLRYSDQGVVSSSISIAERSPQASGSNLVEDSESDVVLPGPRQVTTDPGIPGTNPVTGQRQRRPGVSGPPSGT